jgi:N-acetyl-anhydromuramyl-L-alanine amidase AmpD
MICQIVDDNNIAYHAGYSYFNKFESLNKNSIGIEFISPDPFKFKFSSNQMQSGIFLINNLIDKYHVKNRYILGHSDISYNPENGYLDRKQDPSHLFDWEILAENNIGLYPRIYLQNIDDHLLFENGDSHENIFLIKEKLYNFGYKISEINNDFDEEMIRLVRVFNRHYNNSENCTIIDNELSKLNCLLITVTSKYNHLLYNDVNKEKYEI